MADRKTPIAGGDDDDVIGDAEIFLETPTAPSVPVAPADDGYAGGLLIAEPLPEMGPDIWQAGIQALVNVSDGAGPAVSPPEDWASEARLFRVEANLADSATEAAALFLAAARAAEAAGDGASAAALYAQALGRAPDAPDVLRSVARYAETVGDFEGALAAWERLATAAETSAERAFYAGLTAEWSLARTGKMSRAARNAIPAGPARALAIAEADLVAGAPADVALALAEAGEAIGGATGAVLLEQAARFSEAARDRGRAAAQRTAARGLDPEGRASLFGRLRDIARADGRAAAGPLAALASELPPGSAFAHATLRAAAERARRSGDLARAGTLLAGLTPTTTSAARDRVDVGVETSAALDGASLERLRAGAPAGPAAATLAWLEAENLARRGEAGAALAVVARAVDDSTDAVPLGLVAEGIAAAADEPGARATALELWLRVDPARRAEAALALAAARDAAADEASPLAARAALQTAIEAAPGSALFWTVAAADARAGRHGDAAATLGYGAETWGGSPIAPALRACAAAHLAVAEPRRALEALQVPGVAEVFGAEAAVALATRVGDTQSLDAALAAALAGPAASDDPDRRVALAVRRSMLATDAGARARSLAAALRLLPDHPLALALWLCEESRASTAAPDLLWKAGERTPGPGGLGALYRMTAAALAELGDDVDDALRHASELVDGAPGDRLAQLAVVRAAARLDPDRRARALAELPVNAASDPDVGLAVAEALVESGQGARAAVVLRELRGGRFATEGRRGLARLGAEGGQLMPPGLLFGAADETAAVVRSELGELGEAVRDGRWDAVIAALETGPPQEAVAGAATLHLAAMVAAGRCAAGEQTRLDGAALDAPGEAEGLPPSVLARLADVNRGTALGSRAFARCIERLAALPEPRSVAVFELERTRSGAGEGEGTTVDPIRSWRAALAADPTCLPAALALRREVARRGDLRAAIDATEVEADQLRLPANRVRALLLAAALAEEASRGAAAGSAGDDPTVGVVPGKGRALRLLHAALEIDPAHDGAFEQLRALLEEVGDWNGLAAALAARIAVAANPFEVTALRLARAEVLAGKVGDRSGAREELDAILHKQPEHARALARLSEICWDDQAWSDAGEIYLRRALVEREPRMLREIFLRLGQIYGERVPDAKRAIMAFERVRTLEPDNRQALRALSELYLAEGDPKLALPVTERAAALETDPKRKTALLVRLGELLMRTSDLRRAAIELGRAVDGAPRDLAAVTALAQLLERARDQAGRRALLDRTVGLLRHDLDRGAIDETALRTLASVLALRDSPAAATAAAQLLVALRSGEAAGARAASDGGRRVEALRRPELDDRSFPPGLPPGVRQLMRSVGPLLRASGAELGQALARQGVTRAERAGRGTPPRPVFDAVATELHAGEFELYVKAGEGAGRPAALRVEPGAPPALIVGAAIVERGGAATRFAAARTLRLVATGLDVLLAVPPEEAAAILVGVIRQFVPEYRHPGVRDTLVDAESARAARIVPRKLRAQLMPFAVESAGAFDFEALHAAVRDGANAAGLVASGDLPAALSVVLAVAGGSEALATPLSLASIVASPEALALLRFAVSDDFDELVRAMESS